MSLKFPFGLSSTGAFGAACSVLVDYRDNLETLWPVRRMLYSNGIPVGFTLELCKSLLHQPQRCSSSQFRTSDWRNVWEDPQPAACRPQPPSPHNANEPRFPPSRPGHVSYICESRREQRWSQLVLANGTAVNFFVTFWFEFRASVVPPELQTSTHTLLTFIQHLYTRATDGS